MAASLPRRRFVLTLAIATIGTLIGLMVMAGHNIALPIKVLGGTTGQKTTLYLAVRGDRAVAVKTSLGARCGDGSTWAAKWSPAEGHPVQFTATGNSFSTRESVKLTYTHGVYGSAEFQLRGWLTSAAVAEGTIRLQASFYVDRKWAFCDSQPVAWAVGPKAAARLSTVALGT